MKIVHAITAAVVLLSSGHGYAVVNAGDTVELTLQTLDGKELDLQQLRGKVVLLDFWATWCQPCKKSFPFYADLAKRHESDGLVVVAVSIDERKKPVQRFVQKHPVPFQIAWDPKQSLVERFEPTTMPTAYLLGRDGIVKHIHAGFRDSDKESLRARIERELQAKPATPPDERSPK